MPDAHSLRPDGKVAPVTGTSCRTGRAIADARVAVSSHAQEALDDVTGERSLPGMDAYNVSKDVVLMTEVLAAGPADRKIRAKAIAPGFVRTPFSSVLWDDEVRAPEFERLTPRRRIADPEELSPLALYLTSDASAFVTGGRFQIGGGQLVGTPR